MRGERETFETKALERHTERLNLFRAGFAAKRVFVEEPWGFDISWLPCDFEADDAWVRGLLDLFELLAGDLSAPTHIHGYDWKTGKRYPPKHLQQEQLYAVFAFRKYPSLERFDFSFVYVDEKHPWEVITTFRSYTRIQAARLMDNFTRRATRMTTDTTFRPHPNIINCQYCDFADDCEWAVRR